MDYFMIGLQNFIFHNYKRPLIKERGEYKNEVYVEGMETRCTDMCLLHDLDDLTDKVYNKVMEKLADKITDDVVDRILSRIAENKKEKEEKIRFSIDFEMRGRYDVGNYF